MSTSFADTFYWIALTTPLDTAHERSKQFKDSIVTTQEVLTEYLNFFCSGHEQLRLDRAFSQPKPFMQRAVTTWLVSAKPLS